MSVFVNDVLVFKIFNTKIHYYHGNFAHNMQAKCMLEYWIDNHVLYGSPVRCHIKRIKIKHNQQLTLKYVLFCVDRLKFMAIMNLTSR